MDKLRLTLTELQELLKQMEDLLMEEIKQLSLIKVNPIALQSISDNKCRLLSAIDFYDKQRRQIENQNNAIAPYTNAPKFFKLWESIVAKTKNTNELNHRSFVLLEIQMKKMEAFKKLVKDAGMKNSIYAPSGKTEHGAPGQAYNISV
ncbi:flagella synthesis protein FlgN [Serratia fonticola]|uniref:flagella synthesis protein FlgN n=1 Tax=Serratia fonticola TaxID=47917 RepID=UPI0004237B66|nr:flagellar export chaperone FlgN [Serratia fonticola]